MRITPWSRRSGRVMLAFGTAVVLLSAAPATAMADPPEVSVPDDGSRPEGDPGTVGGDPLPSSGDSPVAGPGVSRGPYANRIAQLAKEVAVLGESTTAAGEEVTLRGETVVAARAYWLDLQTQADQLAELAAEMAAQAYQESASQVQGVTDEFDDLFAVDPGLLGDDRTTVQRQADAAADDAAVALAALDAAVAAEAIAANDYADLVEELDAQTKKLEDLVEENAEAIAVQEEQAGRESKYELGDIGTDVDGWQAAKAAQDAVRYAVAQVGKPYEWGAEGPYTFDCSGLVQTAYAKQGVNLPRVANDQFRATRSMAVDVEKMLPGDLIFYGDRAGDWTSVYHVGMYIGDGMMVHAPRPGDVVKVVPVWFSDFFGAHRVVAAVEVDDGDDGSNEPGDGGDPGDGDGGDGGEPGDGGTPSTRPDPTPSEETPSDPATSGSGDGGDGTESGEPEPTPSG
ncbi:NlpC/P60 family protein [Stackebrandtia albiflava]|uniref:NlpC/P60 family protein n=1 Tax=Stackebrandtia albiflava TaxID=406432 RepID=A0A562UR43_9ACTN|nr:C40 family peptidase [Stackebrandtia albiflava]TWJ08095.1 NlpC/P60 family protein [Stackebrandtia albiflava]